MADPLRGFRAAGGERWSARTAHGHVQESDDRHRLGSRRMAARACVPAAAVVQASGLVVGLLWLAINVGLDLLILVPLTKMSLPDYASEIALRYLVVPIMAVAIDAVGGTSGDAG
jgi:hypothetical protein